MRYDILMHLVAQLIHDRIQGKKDNAVLALVIGGGAMRGVCAAGMLSVLEEAGATDHFDHVYGASAGATNGAIFLARQCRTLLPALLTLLGGKRFIHMTRRGLHADVGMVFRQLFMPETLLNTARIIAHRTVLHISAIDATTGAAAWFTNRDGTDLVTALHASAAIPSFYNKPVAIGGRSYLDGGVAAPLAVDQAFQDGATHVLALSTVTEAYRAVNRHPLVERWMRRKTGKFGVGFREVFAERYARFNESLDLAFGRVPPPARVALLTVAPATLIGWAERRHTVLQRAVQEGREEMRRVLL